MGFFYLGYQSANNQHKNQPVSNAAEADAISQPIIVQLDDKSIENIRDIIDAKSQNVAYSLISKAVADGMVEAQHRLRQEEIEHEQQEHKAWQDAIGYKDFKDAPPVTKFIETIVNRFIVMLKLPFVNKEKIKGTRASEAVQKMFCKCCVFLFWLFIWIWLAGFALAIIQKTQTIGDILTILVAGITTLNIWSLSRTMRIEIDKMSNNTVTSLSAVILGAIGIIVTILFSRGTA